MVRFVVVCNIVLLLAATALPAQSIRRFSDAQLSMRQGAVAPGQRTIAVALTNATVEEALKTVAQLAGIDLAYAKHVATIDKRITLQRVSITAADAFAVILQGTGLEARAVAGGRMMVVPVRAGRTSAVQGTITGKVIDGASKRPIAGATVEVMGEGGGAGARTRTGDDGTFRLTGVPAGSQTLVVRVIGYAKVSRHVSVADDVTVTADIALEPTANALDQIVVTGTVVATELKAVPSAITVITAKQIEERGITKIDQLFRGDIPGLFAMNQGSGALLDEVTMFSRGATALDASSAGTSFSTNPIKTYVDGVELADPKYLSQIDPRSIDRIEVLTGPQASTIYGSNAINGVMQVFTKRGSTSRPQLSLSLLSGWVENNFSSARTPQHDYSAQLSGVEGRLSYNAGGSWNYMGPWTPAKQLARTGGFGGVRIDLPMPVGRVTADMTLRRSVTQSLQRGAPDQTFTGYRETGWYTNSSSSGLIQPTTRTLAGQTLGMTLSYVPASWWSHELGLGSDASEAETRRTGRGYLSISDTTLLLSQSHTDRRSLRYATTARIPLSSLAQATVTVGADAWQNLTSFTQVEPQTQTGSLTGSTSVARQPGHNTGGFLQTQIGVKDRLFFTYGLRAEWNPGYGDEAQPNYAPRYGIAYTQELGAVTAKLRGSYGRSTRPPQPKLKAGQTAVEVFGASSSIFSYYAPFEYYLANSELAPEHQQGGEGGLELYLGTRGSLVVTRYNQTVDALITSPQVDSVRSQTACRPTCSASSQDAGGYGYLYQYQYLNIGTIRNQGWELQGSVHVGPITTRGTYSWTKSRTIGVNPKYSSQFVSPQYQPGASFRYLPEHTWGLGVTYARGSSAVGLNVTGAGQATNLNDDLFFRSLFGAVRLPQDRLNISNTGRYISFNRAYALADLTASHRFLPRVEGVLQVQNLADRYTNDFRADYASLGRQTKLGLRLR